MNDKILSRKFVFAIFMAAVFSSAQAEPMHHGDEMHGKDHGAMKMAAHGEHKMDKKSHMFTPHWAQTLSDDQKLDIDTMHLQVSQFETVQRAKVKLLKSELDVLAAKSPNDKKAIYAKIDEIMEVKKNIMRNRYDHIVEMREALNKQQRISYDGDLLKPRKHKDHD